MINKRSQRGFEPRTSSTLRMNHTPRPLRLRKRALRIMAIIKLQKGYCLIVIRLCHWRGAETHTPAALLGEFLVALCDTGGHWTHSSPDCHRKQNRANWLRSFDVSGYHILVTIYCTMRYLSVAVITAILPLFTAFAPYKVSRNIQPNVIIQRIQLPLYAEDSAESKTVLVPSDESSDDEISLDTVESLGKGAAKVCSTNGWNENQNVH